MNVKTWALLLCFAVVGCKSSRTNVKVEEGTAFNDEPAKSVRFQTQWIKYRGSMLHVSFMMTNLYDFGVVIDSDSARLIYAGKEGYQKALIKPVSLQPHKSKSVVFKFEFDETLAKREELLIELRPRSHLGRELPAAVLRLPKK